MQYTIFKIKEEIKEAIVKAVDAEIDINQLVVSEPPSPEMGDFAVGCFYLSKLLRRSPNQVALELKDKIHPKGLIASVQNIGPYLNFSIDKKVFFGKVLDELSKKGDKFGQLKETEKVMIEYSAPNTHKEFHIGHLRNVVLGGSLVNLYRFAGKKVVAVNYIGDVGAHVAKCLWALDKFHAGDAVPENKGEYLGKIYAEGATKVEENEEYKKEASEVLQKLENGDKKWLSLWKKTRKWSLDDFNRIYNLLGVKFDKFFYESEVEKSGKKIVADLINRGIAEKSQGAIVINLEKYGLKTFLLLKSDGSSLYSTKELALAELKFNKYKIDKSIVITDSRQNFYFEQFFKTLEVMGFDKKLIHLSYEFVTLKDGAMASRKGNVILFEWLYQEVLAAATSETKKRHHDWSEEKVKEIAAKIAQAAIKFNMIKVGNNSIIVFDIDEALSFEGFTGPYLLYMISRINSILKKSNFKTGKIKDGSVLDTEIEKNLIIKAAQFPEIIKKTLDSNEPSELAKYLFELAKSFSNFYENVPVLSAPEDVKLARLSLILSVKQVLVNGLGILGIAELSEM